VDQGGDGAEHIRYDDSLALENEFQNQNPIRNQMQSESDEPTAASDSVAAAAIALAMTVKFAFAFVVAHERQVAWKMEENKIEEKTQSFLNY